MEFHLWRKPLQNLPVSTRRIALKRLICQRLLRWSSLLLIRNCFWKNKKIQHSLLKRFQLRFKSDWRLTPEESDKCAANTQFVLEFWIFWSLFWNWFGILKLIWNFPNDGWNEKEDRLLQPFSQWLYGKLDRPMLRFCHRHFWISGCLPKQKVSWN